MPHTLLHVVLHLPQCKMAFTLDRLSWQFLQVSECAANIVCCLFIHPVFITLMSPGKYAFTPGFFLCVSEELKESDTPALFFY